MRETPFRPLHNSKDQEPSLQRAASDHNTPFALFRPFIHRSKSPISIASFAGEAKGSDAVLSLQRPPRHAMSINILICCYLPLPCPAPRIRRGHCHHSASFQLDTRLYKARLVSKRRKRDLLPKAWAIWGGFGALPYLPRWGCFLTPDGHVFAGQTRSIFPSGCAKSVAIVVCDRMWRQ